MGRCPQSCASSTSLILLNDEQDTSILKKWLQPREERGARFRQSGRHCLVTYVESSLFCVCLFLCISPSIFSNKLQSRVCARTCCLSSFCPLYLSASFAYIMIHGPTSPSFVSTSPFVACNLRRGERCSLIPLLFFWLNSFLDSLPAVWPKQILCCICYSRHQYELNTWTRCQHSTPAAVVSLGYSSTRCLHWTRGTP